MTSVALAPRLDTAAAEPLWSELSRVHEHDTHLDASAVELLGARCLEVILTARNASKAAGRRFVVEPLSDAAVQDLRTFGLSPSDISSGDAS